LKNPLDSLWGTLITGLLLTAVLYMIVRTMMGSTNSAKAAPGTIRGDLSVLFTENLVHGSDSAESAAREIGIFFPNLA